MDQRFYLIIKNVFNEPNGLVNEKQKPSRKIEKKLVNKNAIKLKLISPPSLFKKPNL